MHSKEEEKFCFANASVTKVRSSEFESGYFAPSLNLSASHRFQSSLNAITKLKRQRT